MFLVILHAEIVLCSFSFVVLPCDVTFLFHCSLKSEDLVIKVALIEKYLLKDKSSLTPQIISNTALWVHPCEFVPIITSLAYRD
jgi:hypothetical protein